MRDAMKQRAMMTHSLAMSYVTGGSVQTRQRRGAAAASPGLIYCTDCLRCLSVCLSGWLADAVVEALSACPGRQRMNDVVIFIADIYRAAISVGYHCLNVTKNTC